MENVAHSLSTKISVSKGDKSKNVSSQSPEKSSLAGMAYIFSGIVIFSASSLIIKALEDDGVPFLQVTLIRYVVVFLITGALIIYRRRGGRSFPFLGVKGERTVLVIRAALYFGALNFYYCALLYIPIGLVTVIGYSFPLLVAMISHWGLISDPEKLSWFGWLCSVSAFLGIALALSAEDESGSSVEGILMAVGSTLCWAIQVIIIRRTRTSTHWLQLEFVTGMVNAVFLSPGLLVIQWIVNITNHDSPDRELTLVELSTRQWVECIVVGAIAFSALACFTIGFQLEQAPRGCIVMYMEIPIMYVAQWIVFGQGISLIELIGVLIMICGIMGSAVEKILIMRKEASESLITTSSVSSLSGAVCK